MSQPIATLGLIAGNRSLPLELARNARALGVQRLVAVAFEGETDPALAELVDRITWLRVGQLSRLITAFTEAGVRQCVMAGQIAPRNLFDLRPDLRAVKLLWRVKEKNAHTLFGAIAEELSREGIELIPATPWLQPLMPAAGFRVGRAPTAAQQEDLAFGFRMAKAVSQLDIGQLVVVRHGAVLAVEGFEGTDRCLQRGGELAGKRDAVAVKVAKQNHDMRFDIPCLGAATLQTCIDAGVAVLGFEAGKTLLLERAEVERLAKRGHVTLIALS